MIITVSFVFFLSFFVSGSLIWKIRLEGRIESSATITGDFTQVPSSFYYCATVPYSLTDKVDSLLGTNIELNLIDSLKSCVGYCWML